MAWHHSLADFFITEWLWSMTLGSYHALLATLFFIFLLRYSAKFGWIASIIAAATANLFSYIVYGFLVVGVIAKGVDRAYIPMPVESPQGDISWAVGMYLGLLYCILQALFFYIVRLFYPLHFWRVVSLALIAQMLAALSVHLLLPAH